MQKLSIKQRSHIVQLYFENNSSTVATQRAFRRIYANRNGPSPRCIRRIVAKFKELGNVQDRQRLGRSRTGRSIDKIESVRQDVAATPQKSVSRRSDELQISKTTLWRILKKDLKCYPYKIQLVQNIDQNDFEKRLQFAHSFLEIFQDEDKICSLMMTDEAHFHLNGFVNKQNFRFWGGENPQVIHVKELHPQRVTVWCGIMHDRVIGPYFFENAAGFTETVNGERYRHMLHTFLRPALIHLHSRHELWFQQDGATCHTANDTMELLHEMFGNNIISRRATLAWPPRSPDLTAPDYFLWGYLKERVYTNKPETLEDLKENIRREIHAINPATLRSVMNNALVRARACIAVEGRHLKDVIFHT